MNKYLDKSKKVIDFSSSRPNKALERLNRLTGLNFSHLPTSLLDESRDTEIVTQALSLVNE